MENKVEYVQIAPNGLSAARNGNNLKDPKLVEISDSTQTGCFRRIQKDKPQTQSASSAALIFVSGGMNIAWSTGFASAGGISMTLHMQICWFVGAIIGAFLQAVVNSYVQKKFTLYFSAILVILGGSLSLAQPLDPRVLVAARYIDGIANGLTFVATLILVGEQAVKTIRGSLASISESMCFALGIFIQITYSYVYMTSSPSINSYQIPGAISIIMGVLSIILIFFFLIESPVYYLRNGDESLALDAQRRLQRPFDVTAETLELLDEHKRYIAMNNESSLFRNAIAARLLKLCFYRAMLTLSFSKLSNLALNRSLLIGQGLPIWPMMLYGAIRYLGVVCTAILMDKLGRKVPTLVGALICGCLALGLGVLLNSPLDIYNTLPLRRALYLLIAFQLAAGIFVTPSSVYLTEAFPLAVKHYFIAIAFSVEMIVQIVINILSSAALQTNEYFFAMGGLMLVFCAFGFFCLPETKKLTLREAQEKFRGILAP